MPAGFPGESSASNQGNPQLGAFVIMDGLAGPKGSPFDNDRDYANAVSPYFKLDTGTPSVANANCSTGALQTGIGFGQPGPFTVAGAAFNTPPGTPLGFQGGRFTDDYQPGITKPDGTAASDSTYCYIGGGKCTKNVDGSAPVVPYTAGFGICGGGNGGSRDSGLNTGFAMKTVTATGTVANGGVVETGFVNRTGASIATGTSVFGSATVALAASS